MSEAKNLTGSTAVTVEELPTLELREDRSKEYSELHFYDVFVNGEETNLWVGIARDKSITVNGILTKGVKFKIGKYGYYHPTIERKARKAK